MPAAKTDWDKGEIQSCWQKMTVLNSFWFIFSFKSSSYLMLDKPVARTMLAIYELSPTDILNLYLANVPSFFFLPPVFSFCCDNAVLMFWLYWGTRTSWFGLGKDHIFASCYSGNCPNILLKPYGSRLQIVVAKISSDVATASSFMLPIHAKMFVSNCNTTTRGRSSESNWSPDLQFYSAVFSSRPISSQLLCSKCLSLRLADVNILKLTTSSQNLSAKSFNIPTSCSLDVSLSNYWLHCPQPRPEVLLCGPISENMDKINAEYGKKAQYQYVCPSDLQYKVPTSCPKHPVVSNLWMLVLNSGLFVIITVAWNVLMKCTRGLQKRTMPIFLSSNQAALKWTCESHLNPASDVHLFENEKEWPCSN